MAGIDTRNTLPAVPPRTSTAAAQRLAAVKEAQRAFFGAALAGEAQPQAASATTVGALAPTPTPTGPDPRRRPGSIVDIKV